MHTALVLAPFLLATVGLALILPVIYKLCRSGSIEDISPEWLENFSPSSYDTMRNLLAEDDFKFISRQPGFDLQLYRKLRHDRLRIFRQYLNRMIRDFNRLHLAARAILANSPEDCSELATRLIWLKVRFSMSVLKVQMNYFLCYAGVSYVTASVLIVRLEEMSAQLNSIAAANAAA